MRSAQAYDVPKQLEGLPEMKPEDQQYFGKLLKVGLSTAACTRRFALMPACMSHA